MQLQFEIFFGVFLLRRSPRSEMEQFLARLEEVPFGELIDSGCATTRVFNDRKLTAKCSFENACRQSPRYCSSSSENRPSNARRTSELNSLCIIAITQNCQACQLRLAILVRPLFRCSQLIEKCSIISHSVVLVSPGRLGQLASSFLIFAREHSLRSRDVSRLRSGELNNFP